MRTIFCVALIFSASVSGAQQLPWPMDPWGNDYRVDATYGPRNVTKGTFFHKGLDLNQQGTGGITGNADLNLPLTAAAAGTIFGIGRTGDGLYWIGIDYGNGRTFAYLHVFPSSITCSGNFRVTLDNDTTAKNNEIKSYRRIYTDEKKLANKGVVLFYSENNQKGRIVKALGINNTHPERLAIGTTDYQAIAVSTAIYPVTSTVVSAGTDGVLETMPYGDDVYSGDKMSILVGPNGQADTTAGYVTVSTTVVEGEIISPLGMSGATNAHLHLQVSHADSKLGNDPSAGADYNDGLDNVIQYLVHGMSEFLGGISIPAADSVLYHTDSHDAERVIARIRQSQSTENYQTFHGYELDRVKLFAIPAEFVNDSTDIDEISALLANDTYLINGTRDVGAANSDKLRDSNDPFRAEFNYGGSVPDSPFPPALRYPGLESKSINAKTTGLWPEGELNINPNIDFVFNQWNTRVNKEFSDSAYRNQDAAYPDGWYGLVATAESVDRDPYEKFVSEPIGVNIDNFRPYVDAVTIADAADLENPVYSRGWVHGDSALTPQAEYSDGPLIPGHTYRVTATMSEYTQYAAMRTLDGATIPIIKAVDYADTHNSEYTGEITIPGQITEDKVVPLVIQDMDTAEPSNSLLKIDSGRTIDINPALELTRGADGAMQGIGGDDIFHCLRIDVASPIIRFNRQEKPYQALADSCAGRPTDLCGTEEEPINITYSSVPFSYTDIGSGLKNLTIYKEVLGGAIFYENPGLSRSVRAFAFKGAMTIPDGKYVQTLTDNLGHTTTMYFRIDPVTPRLEISSITMSPPFATFNAYGVVIDTGSGLDYMRLSQTGLPDVYANLVGGTTESVNYSFPGLKVGGEDAYMLTAQDKAENLRSGAMIQFVNSDVLDPAPGMVRAVAHHVTGMEVHGDTCTVTVTSVPNDLEVPVEDGISDETPIVAQLTAARSLSRISFPPSLT